MTNRACVLVLLFVFLSGSDSSAGEEKAEFGREAGFFLGFGFGVAGKAAFVPADESAEYDAALVFNVGKIFNKHFMLGGEIAHQGILAVGYYQMGVMTKIYPSSDLGLFLKLSGGFAFYDPLDIWGHTDGESGGGFRASVGWDFHQIGKLFGLEIEFGYGVLFLSGRPYGGDYRDDDDNYKIDIVTGLMTFSIYGKEVDKH